MNNGKLNSVIFVDIKKAFETVDHKSLLLKLFCYEIKGNSLKLIEKQKDRIQYCSVKEHVSSLKRIECGVPQGSIVRPLLFLIYMNHLPHFLPNVDITMFADVTSFAKAFKGASEIKEHLVLPFSKLCRWLKFNKLSLNTVKTEFMITGTPNSICNLDKDPGGTLYLIVGDSDRRIRRVKLVKSLGLIVDDTLTWSNLKRSVGIIKKTSKYLDKNSLLMLYRTLVETHFRYCNVIWGQCAETLIDKPP